MYFNLFIEYTKTMSKKNRVILILCLLIPFGVNGQISPPAERCGTVDYNIRLNQNNPQRTTEAEFEKWLGKQIQKVQISNQALGFNSQQNTTQAFTIPVIFHVIHDGEQIGDTPNLNSTYINAQLAQLNLDFANLSGSNYSQAADTEIRFCAAKIDPTGACLAEPGINRVNRNSLGLIPPPFTSTYFNSSIQPLTQWNPDDYCNIWIGQINGEPGFAQLPEANNLSGVNNNNGLAITDGCIVNYTTVGSVALPNPINPISGLNSGRTLTHEIGHWLGLRHIWGDGALNRPNCGLDDYCSDTPPQANPSAGCPLGNDTCPSAGNDMIENYMDYTSDVCMHTFTEDQRDRMLTVIDPIVGSPRRASLNDSPACDCAPLADFSPTDATLHVCTTSNTIQFNNESIRTYGGTSYLWSFSGAGVTPNNTTLENPVVSITNSGTLTVTLTVTNANGTDTTGPINYQVTQVQNAPTPTTLTTPQNGMFNQNLSTSLNWIPVSTAEKYLVEVSTNQSFSSVVFSEITTNSTIVTSVLEVFTDYFWRVIAINNCNASNPFNGNSSPIWTFKTLDTTCQLYTSIDTPLTIPTSGTNTIQSIITIPAGLGPIADISISNLSITHSWVSDLEVSVTAPDGTDFLLFKDICGSQNDVDLSFHDSGLANTSIPCPPTDGNTHQASSPFSVMQGRDGVGDWVLTVRDIASGDGGQIDSWELEICTEDQVSCPGSLTLNVSANHVSCFSGIDGSLTANASGGNTPYQYLWEDSSGAPLSTNVTINNLSADTYFCTVTDNDGCEQSLTALITEPTLVSVQETLSNVSCNGSSSGQIDLILQGGVTPYSYAWSTGQTSPTITNLSAGIYTVTVADNNTCSQVITYQISEPPALSNTETITNVNCFGGTDGHIDITVFGGTLHYSYLWSNSATTQDLNNLSAGTYDVTISDGNNCTIEKSYQIHEPSQVSVVETITNIDCFADDSGEISLIVNGGTAPYSYTWSSGETTNIITAKSAGNYSVTVADANNCLHSFSYTITQPSQTISIQLDMKLDVSCFGDNNGELAITATGGTPPYVYNWSNGASTTMLSNLDSGTYILTVTDDNECESIESWDILEPLVLEYQIMTSQDISCFGEDDGMATLDVTGGTGPYTIDWSTGETGVTATQLIAGSNSFTITDDQGCILIDSVDIIEPDILAINVVASTDPTCIAETNGTIEIQATGGASPYSYSWSTGDNSNLLTGLPAGDYLVTVTDDNSCSTEAMYTISDPDFTLNAAIQQLTCSGNMDGVVTVNPIGDGAPFSYLWFDGSTQNTVDSLAAGTYGLTLTDSNNCIYIESFEVDMPTAITVVTSSSDITCSNVSTGTVYATASGGVGPYTYQWEDAQGNSVNTTDLLAGDYFVTAIDASSCVGMSMVTINPPVTEYTMNNSNQLTGSQFGNADFEVDGKIESDQTVLGNNTAVDYDSGISIELKAGFEVKPNAVFHAFIDGCGGAQ